jgi:hypothetical protein
LHLELTKLLLVLVELELQVELLKVLVVLGEEIVHSTQSHQSVAVAVVLGLLITEQTVLAVVPVVADGSQAVEEIILAVQELLVKDLTVEMAPQLLLNHTSVLVVEELVVLVT